MLQALCSATGLVCHLLRVLVLNLLPGLQPVTGQWPWPCALPSDSVTGLVGLFTMQGLTLSCICLFFLRMSHANTLSVPLYDCHIWWHWGGDLCSAGSAPLHILQMLCAVCWVMLLYSGAGGVGWGYQLYQGMVRHLSANERCVILVLGPLLSDQGVMVASI